MVAYSDEFDHFILHSLKNFLKNIEKPLVTTGIVPHFIATWKYSTYYRPFSKVQYIRLQYNLFIFHRDLVRLVRNYM